MTDDNKPTSTGLLDHPTRHHASKSEAWGQPPASSYVFIVIDDVMYGQMVGSNYIATYQIPEPEQIEFSEFTELESQNWLSLAESAFDFWDNEQDAIFDSL